MTLRSLRTRAVALALVAVVVACQQDREDVTEPITGIDGPPSGVFNIAGALTCRADVRAQSISCHPRRLVTGELGPNFLIVGGQGTFVELFSPVVSYDPGTEIFQADVQVANYLGDATGVGQQLGTPDEIQTTGVRVFFHAGPTVTGGTGTATVRNPDGTGMFTGSNQPYHEYDFVIPPGFITPPKTWEWDVTNTVTTFEFEVFVEADVPHPDGFVQVIPEEASIAIGGNVTIAASIRDVVNRVGSGTITFSSADETIAIVNSTTGEVTGVGPGTVQIIASSSGSEAPGVAMIMIPEAGYQIRLRYLTAVTASQQTAFENAKARWESHLTGDVFDITINSLGLPVCNGVPINEVIDDLVIYVILGPIDDVGGILGQAAPCALRPSGSDLPALGFMRFDTADLAALEANNQLEAVILHEMGHVLGFGILWDASILNLRLGTGTSDPRFTGPAAIAAYLTLGATGAQCNPPTITTQCVPLEGTGGPGTADAHWREDPCATCQTTDFFGSELMTGFISAPGNPNPLSIVSIDQFTDLGYPGVNNTGADPYTLNTAAAALAAGPRLKLVNDIWRGPLYRIEDDGTLTMVLPDRR